MDRPIVALVMAGGTGTRLYPASRSDRPKQFHPFGGERSLLERTVDRLDFADEVVVSTREAYADAIPEHAPGAAVLVEPAAKDTGPALAYATHEIGERYAGGEDDPVVLCVPSDHWIEGDFEGVAVRATEVAVETGGLVTLGIDPDRPATGYGYVQPGEECADYAPIAAFHEKPGVERAREFVEAGYYWNAGIFAWTPGAFLREARASPLAPLVEALEAGDPEDGFASVESTSVDYAVMERTDDAYVVPADFAWDDLGSWDAIGRVFGDGSGARLCESLELDASGNVIAGEDVHVTAIGVSGLVIAAYGDRVLVVSKDESERVREAANALAEVDRF